MTIDTRFITTEGHEIKIGSLCSDPNFHVGDSITIDLQTYSVDKIKWEHEWDDRGREYWIKTIVLK